MSILIIAPYPNEENIKDGMLMRVKAIDDLLGNKRRKYLNVSFGNCVQYKSIKHNNYTEEIFLHPIWHFKKIIEIIKESINIYAHSINAFRYIPYALKFIDKKRNNLILDAHGVVPEEFLMYNKRIKAYYLNIIERMIFRRIKHCISVSEAMNEHFVAKYSDVKDKWNNHLYYIYNSVMSTESIVEKEELKIQLGILDTDCVLIYSGNLQKWQNIDLMLKTISNIHNDNIKIIILTGNREGFLELIASYDLKDKVYINSVHPSELGKYYSISNYGFLLRDDIVVNRVANPTKMLEYLSFGIVPVVICPNIGDYDRLGYDYVSIDKLNADKLIPIKSKKNVETASNIILMNQIFKIDSIIIT